MGNVMVAESYIRWGLAQRFEFLEWRAYWVGRVNRKDFEDQFGISTPQASSDFGRYQSAAPGNIEYDSTLKTYVATDDFRPQFLKLSPERYLLQVQAIQSQAIRKEDTWFDQLPSADVEPAIVRGPEAYVLRALIEAIEMSGSIDINYRSLTRTAVRKICPHALGYDGYRWHVRALSLEHNEYRDYVLGRILSVSKPEECDVDPSDDLEWNTEVTLTLVAHPDLDADQQETIEREYRCRDGELTIKIRLALAYYFIKRHNLDLRNGEIPPERAQIYLKNFDEVKLAEARAKEQSNDQIRARIEAQRDLSDSMS